MKQRFTQLLLIFTAVLGFQYGQAQITFNKQSHSPLDPSWATTFKTLWLIDGNLWCVGSNGTYSKRNGTTWVKDQMPNTSVSNRSIALDNQSNLWVGTFGDGLFKLEGSTWTQLVQSNSILPSEYIPALLFDTIQHDLWIATYDGLVRKNGDIWQLYNTGNSQLADNEVTGIQQAADGAIWVVNGHGLTKIHNNIWTTYTSSQIFGGDEDDLGDVFIDASQKIWITSGYGLKGVASFDGTTWTVLPGFADKNIQSVGVNASSTVFLGELFKGMHVVSGGVNYYFPSAPDGFPSAQNFDFNLDKDGNTLWMCNTWGLWEIKSATVGTSELNEVANGVSAFPVPAFDNVTITSENSMIQSVNVIGSDGALIETLQFGQESSVEVPVNKLATGVYFLQTTLANKQQSVIRIAVNPK